MRCELCQAFEVEWVHQLDPARSTFRVYGKGHVWAGQINVCSRCEELYREGDDEALVALQVGSAEMASEVIDETIRKPFVVYRDAHRATVPHHDVLPPGVLALREVGFVPVEEVTGDVSVAAAWPVEHRRSVPETRHAWLDDSADGQCWLIRSPWPSISIEGAFSVLWGYVHLRAPIVGGRIDPDQERAAITEFASLDEGVVLDMIAQRDS